MKAGTEGIEREVVMFGSCFTILFLLLKPNQIDTNSRRVDVSAAIFTVSHHCRYYRNEGKKDAFSRPSPRKWRWDMRRCCIPTYRDELQLLSLKPQSIIRYSRIRALSNMLLRREHKLKPLSLPKLSNVSENGWRDPLFPEKSCLGLWSQ